MYSVVQNVWNRERCVSFPAPLSFIGTSSFCWRFWLLAVICRPILQLAHFYVVFFQLLQHAVPRLFVRVLFSIRHINIRCKKFIDVLWEFNFIYVLMTKCDKFHVFMLYHLRISRRFSPFRTFHYIPHHLTDFKYQIWLCVALRTGWHTLAESNAILKFWCWFYWFGCCRLFLVLNRFDGNIFCYKYMRLYNACGNLIVNVD